MIDVFLEDFNYSLEQKFEIVGQFSKSFIHEFEFSEKEYKIQLDRKYRFHRQNINEIILDSSETQYWYAPIKEVLIDKSKKIIPIAEALIKQQKQNELDVPLNSLLVSYIHMMLNRIFRSNQRTYELVLYDMLQRCYSSQIARISKNTIQNKQ